MSHKSLAGTKTRGVDDRVRRMAFWVGVVGFTQSTLLIGIYAIDHTLNATYLSRYAFYGSIFALIAWTGRSNWRVDIILALGLAGIYLHMWSAAFYDAWTNDVDASVFWFPTLLFAPLFLVLVTGYRVLIGYALLQGTFVYSYTRFFLADVYGLDTTVLNIDTLSIILGLMAGQALLLLAILAFARKRTDHRLFNLINETERLAAEDPLTGLKNRRALMQQIDRFWELKTDFTVVFIDLDRFKPINDEYGHAVGDRVLQTIGKRLQDHSNLACAARLGGDEFAAIIDPQSDDATLHALVEQLHDLLTQLIDVEFGHVSVGASIGYARARLDAASISELLHAADTAMMRCKANHQDIAKFDAQHDNISLSNSAMTEAFRKALDNKQIKPALQPIVDAKSHKVIGYELLARWPNSGLSREPTPAEFIPIAEKLGLLNQLLWQTLMVALRRIDDPDVFLAINVSPSQLSSSHFLDELETCVLSQGVAMDRIEIEVTEHVAFRNLEENVRVLEDARRRGCRIALDDFGSGYSSLSLLEELPLDKVKLDKSLLGTPNKRGVLQATVHLTAELGFICCVEGIEDSESADYVAALGCDEMQGFLFGAPTIIAENVFQLRAVS
ncbi:MAG: EAL domain-containing protein [Pseudomonadota bacterium]